MRRSADLAEDDSLFAQSARRFLAGHPWTPAQRRIPRDRIAEIGWLAMGVPEAEGGIGADAHQVLLVLEELGRVLPEEALGCDLLIAPKALAALGRADLAAALMAGEAGFAFARAEARGTSSLAPGLAGAQWLLLREGAGLRLLSAESFAAVLASAPLLDGRPAGRVTLAALGPAAASVTDPALGAELEARQIAALAADALGALDTGFATTLDYLRTRRQFGQPLAGFQAVQHHMADVYAVLEGLRSQVAALAPGLARPEESGRCAAAVACYLRDRVLPAAGRLIQVCGGIATTEDYIVGHVYKRVLAIGQILDLAAAREALAESYLTTART